MSPRATFEPLYKANNSLNFPRENAEDDEKDPLVVNRTATDNNMNGSGPLKHRRNNYAKNFSPSMAGLSSHAPETESILSMKHLSEGGRLMRTTDPVSS